MATLKNSANLAISAIRNPDDIEKIAADKGMGPKSLSKLTKKFKERAYLAFAPLPLDVAVSAIAHKSKISVVQVGANDGRAGDPIFHLVHDFADRVVLIEPMPELISKLTTNYGEFSGQTIVENIAVGSDFGELSLFRLRPNLWDLYVSKVGRHPTAITSFEKASVFKKIKDRLELDDHAADEAVENFVCPMVPLSNIIEKHGLQDLDLLQIDCEGYDFQVIESIGPYRPAIINFESFNLTRENWLAWKNWAKTNGYGYIQGRHDTLAIKGASFAVDF